MKFNEAKIDRSKKLDDMENELWGAITVVFYNHQKDNFSLDEIKKMWEHICYMINYDFWDEENGEYDEILGEK